MGYNLFYDLKSVDRTLDGMLKPRYIRYQAPTGHGSSIFILQALLFLFFILSLKPLKLSLSYSFSSPFSSSFSTLSSSLVSSLVSSPSSSLSSSLSQSIQLCRTRTSSLLGLLTEPKIFKVTPYSYLLGCLHKMTMTCGKSCQTER